MKVWFGTSTAEFIKYKKYYFAIRDFLVDEGHILTRDWIRPSLAAVRKGQRKMEVHEMYNAVMEAVNKADVLVLEDTVSNFSAAHQITVGLQKRKPVLVLRLSSKNKYFKDTFMDGLRSDYLQVSEYNQDNYQEIIRGFMNKYENATKKHRFNLVIDNVEKNYLEWVKFNSGGSRTEVIRQGIRKLIDTDEEYKNYLRTKTNS